MTIKKFKTDNGYRKNIEVVYVDRESVSSVWIGKRRYGKFTEYFSYFDDFESAREHLLKEAEKELSRARRILESAQGVYGNVNGLKNPDMY